MHARESLSVEGNAKNEVGCRTSGHFTGAVSKLARCSLLQKQRRRCEAISGVMSLDGIFQKSCQRLDGWIFRASTDLVLAVFSPRE